MDDKDITVTLPKSEWVAIINSLFDTAHDMDNAATASGTPNAAFAALRTLSKATMDRATKLSQLVTKDKG